MKTPVDSINVLRTAGQAERWDRNNMYKFFLILSTCSMITGCTSIKQPTDATPVSSDNRSNVITKKMLDISTEFISLTFSTKYEIDIEDQILMTSGYVKATKGRISRETKDYEEYLEKHSLDPIPTAKEYITKIERMGRIKELIDLELEAELTRAELSEVFRKKNKLPLFSSNGLREVNDVTEAIDLLSSATHLTVYANDVLWDLYEETYRGKDGFKSQIQIDSPIIIESIASLIKSANLTYDPEYTKLFDDGGAIDASPQIVIEIDDQAFVCMLGNFFICAENKTYLPKKKNGEIDDDFPRQIAIVLRQFVEGKKDNPNQGMDPTSANAQSVVPEG